MAKTVKKSSTWLKRAKSDEHLAGEVSKVIPLHKVGINWFGRCPYYDDSGSHFCVPHHGKYWQCLKCGKKGVDVPVITIVSQPANKKYEF